MDVVETQSQHTKAVRKSVANALSGRCLVHLDIFSRARDGAAKVIASAARCGVRA